MWSVKVCRKKVDWVLREALTRQPANSSGLWKRQFKKGSVVEHQARERGEGEAGRRGPSGGFQRVS